MYLVNNQQFSTFDCELFCQLHESPCREIHCICRAVQDCTVSGFEVLPEVLLDERGFSHTFRSYNTDKLGIPVNLIHLLTDNFHRCIGQKPVMFSE